MQPFITLSEGGNTSDSASESFAADRAFPNEGRDKPRYRDVSVLLLRWEDDEMNVDWELDDLDKVFMKYGFNTERWLIPRKNAHLKLMSKAIDVVEEHDGKDDLVIVYYAGHAYINAARQATWCCKRDPNYASLEWSAIQTLFEKAQLDVLLLLDCCAAASAAPCVGSAVTETIAACGFESIAPQPGRCSFTNTLIEVLEDWINSPPFSAAMLHNKVLSQLKHEQPERIQSGRPRKRECRATPIFIVATSDPRLPSIELGRRRPVLDSPSIVEKIALDDTNASSTPTSSTVENDLPSSHTLCPTLKRKCYEPESINDLVGREYKIPRVIISLALDEDQSLNSESCQKWLASCPTLVKFAKIEAVFKSFSTLVLVSMPVFIWSLLPDDPACAFIGYSTSPNILSTEVATSSSPSLKEIQHILKQDVRCDNLCCDPNLVTFGGTPAPLPVLHRGSEFKSSMHELYEGNTQSYDKFQVQKLNYRKGREVDTSDSGNHTSKLQTVNEPANDPMIAPKSNSVFSISPDFLRVFDGGTKETESAMRSQSLNFYKPIIQKDVDFEEQTQNIPSRIRNSFILDRLEMNQYESGGLVKAVAEPGDLDQVQSIKHQIQRDIEAVSSLPKAATQSIPSSEILICHANGSEQDSDEKDLDENSVADGAESVTQITPSQILRKEQNQHAQQKFRENKDQYLKELEAKVVKLEGAVKISRYADQESERFKIELQRLSTENELLKSICSDPYVLQLLQKGVLLQDFASYSKYLCLTDQSQDKNLKLEGSEYDKDEVKVKLEPDLAANVTGVENPKFHQVPSEQQTFQSSNEQQDPYTSATIERDMSFKQLLAQETLLHKILMDHKNWHLSNEEKLGPIAGMRPSSKISSNIDATGLPPTPESPNIFQVDNLIQDPHDQNSELFPDASASSSTLAADRENAELIACPSIHSEHDSKSVLNANYQPHSGILESEFLKTASQAHSHCEQLPNCCNGECSPHCPYSSRQLEIEASNSASHVIESQGLPHDTPQRETEGFANLSDNLAEAKYDFSLNADNQKKRKECTSSEDFPSSMAKMKRRIVTVHDGQYREWTTDSDPKTGSKINDQMQHHEDIDVDAIRRANIQHSVASQEKDVRVPEHLQRISDSISNQLSLGLSGGSTYVDHMNSLGYQLAPVMSANPLYSSKDNPSNATDPLSLGVADVNRKRPWEELPPPNVGQLLETLSFNSRSIASSICTTPGVSNRSKAIIDPDVSFVADANEDYAKISDLEESRLQNRISQRIYRNKLRRRLEDLERRAGSSVQSMTPTDEIEAHRASLLKQHEIPLPDMTASWYLGTFSSPDPILKHKQTPAIFPIVEDRTTYQSPNSKTQLDDWINNFDRPISEKPRRSESVESSCSTSSSRNIKRLQDQIRLADARPLMPKSDIYQRLRHDRVQCDQCDNYPEGFRGIHELSRHKDREHKSVVRKWICVEPTDGEHPKPALSLSKCKSCAQTKKLYGAYYNAAAHLRRSHFNPKVKTNGKGTTGVGERNFGGGWPPMNELKHWMKEVNLPENDDDLVSHENKEMLDTSTEETRQVSMEVSDTEYHSHLGSSKQLSSSFSPTPKSFNNYFGGIGTFQYNQARFGLHRDDGDGLNMW